MSTYAEIIANRDTLPMADGIRQKIEPGQTWRCTYGTATGVVHTSAPAYSGGPVRLYFVHDVDPGFGPMAFVPGSGIVLVCAL